MYDRGNQIEPALSFIALESMWLTSSKDKGGTEQKYYVISNNTKFPKEFL